MKPWRIGSAARPSPAAKGPKTSAGEHCCGRAAPRPPLLGRAEEQPSSAAPAAASKTRTQAGTVQRAASGGCVRKVKRKIEARVEARAARSHLYHPVARVMTEVPPAAPRRQRAVRPARRVTRPPAPGTSAVEQRRTRAEPAHKASGGDDARHTTGWPARPFFVNYPHPPERQTSSGRNRSYSAAGAVLSLIESSGSLDRAALVSYAREAFFCRGSTVTCRFEGSLSGLSDGFPTGARPPPQNRRLTRNSYPASVRKKFI